MNSHDFEFKEFHISESIESGVGHADLPQCSDAGFK
jgi:hypothetical protein